MFLEKIQLNTNNTQYKMRQNDENWLLQEDL